jgi:ribonuclease Y
LKIELVLLIVCGALAAGVFIGMLLRKKLIEARFANAERTAAQLIDEARNKADSICKEAIIEAKAIGRTGSSWVWWV